MRRLDALVQLRHIQHFNEWRNTMSAGGAFIPTLGVLLVGENPDNGDIAPEHRVDLRPNQLISSTRLILLLPRIPLGQNAFKRNGI